MPPSAPLPLKSCAWKKWETTRHYGEKERERRGGCGRKVESSFFVQSQLSACCFGNVMSAQPLAIPLRLPRTEHRGVRACVALYKTSEPSCEELTFWVKLNNLSVPTVHKFHLIECFASTFHVLAFFSFSVFSLCVARLEWIPFLYGL